MTALQLRMARTGQKNLTAIVGFFLNVNGHVLHIAFPGNACRGQLFFANCYQEILCTTLRDLMNDKLRLAKGLGIIIVPSNAGIIFLVLY